MKHFPVTRLQFKVTESVRNNCHRNCCHFLHWIIPSRSPAKLCLFAIQSTLSCASAREFSVLSFEQLALYSAANVPNSMVTRKSKKENQKKKNQKCRKLTRLRTHEARILYLLFPQEKASCSNLMTDIQSLKYICLWLPLSATHQAEATLPCGGNERDCLYVSPNGSKQNFFDECLLGNDMHQREPLFREQPSFTYNFLFFLCRSGLMFLYVLWWGP